MARMNLEEKVGQVLMTGFPATGSSAQDRENIAEHSLGNVFLKGRSTEGLEATKTAVDRVKKTIAKSQAAEVSPYVATDQEGGLVQVLKGSGFESMPSAKVQGTWDPAELKAKATTWGNELAGAGINVNLAPVADTVPSAAFAPSNAPIGHFGRQFGFTPQAVSTSSMAFSEGMLAAGVEPVVKHFPGLGRVTKNTDVASDVTDTNTTRNDDYLQPFRDAIEAGNQWVMVSNAYYSKIDAENIAPFSGTIMRDMLRSDLGFEGIIVSDDVCEANQLSPWGLGDRALRFFEAGGTMLLCVDSGKTATMADALVKKASKDPEFARLIDQAALIVLETKKAG
ncbi:beta-N-acetylhexosaminidase [Paeniglutamicibacter kerguelensis]|uniref:beta-N-acetylhexosaminidase n=2 Tax=Paeniglutamicibacter kerguelensis TaxID=254788 RepID=A0ABS4XJC7_9MICC|nr:beta-N-acetylhexosaminidase [Paeniglutamicibacter kerguelensis]